MKFVSPKVEFYKWTVSAPMMDDPEPTTSNIPQDNIVNPNDYPEFW